MVRKKDSKNAFNTSKSLEFLLKDLFGQIKIVSPEEKDVPYIKLIELYFKGIDLKEKLDFKVQEDFSPQINFIEGVHEERL